jgi:3-hydroxyacyl-CoA dehydrogenase
MGVTHDRGEPTRTTVLGTGIMGSAMARNLLTAGLPTTVWDRSTAATRQLAEAGALERVRQGIGRAFSEAPDHPQITQDGETGL